MKFKNICKFPNISQMSDLTISCFVLESDQQVMKTPKKLKDNRMILVEKGQGTFLFDNLTYTFTAGTLIFGFEGETFFLDKGENVSYFYIDFTGIRATSLLSRFAIYSHTRKRDNFNGLIPLFKDFLLSTKQENIDIASESVLLHVFSQLTVLRQENNDIMQKIIKITDENFKEPDISIGLIAKEIGYNGKYLSHFFKKNMNVSYTEYLRSVRLKYAISLFDLGLSSVKNVAILSGFSDPLYFSNIFKKSLGISPTKYVEKTKNNQ